MALFRALLAFLMFAPCSLSADGFQDDGLKALDANQPSTAEALFRRAVAADPNDFSAHFNLALSLSVQQKDAEAIQELHRTLELKPDLYQADVNLGTLLLRNKRPAEAVPVLREAVSQQRTARVLILYAQALDQSGDIAQATEYYGQTLDLDPNSAVAHASLARVELLRSNFPEASAHFRKAASLDPQFRNGLLELAASYEKSKMLPEAVEIYREFPENPAAKERLAQLLVETGNFSAAIPGLENAVKQSPSVANRMALADAWKMNKQLEKALEQLQLAAASEPSNYDVRMILGRELRDQHRLVPAAQQFAAAAKLRPDSDKAWNELASILVVSEDYAGGLAALDRVRALGKEVPGDLYYRGISLEKLRQLKPALEAYKQFLAADSGKLPDQEFLARQRVRIIESELNHK